ncbi:uncharacterized protein LOC17877792 isoform X2 [Capsella rubella]|uniref:uncharacterized protein LOC17877792 isoform X2 n=1 Tax=Capsella rubella TaxID=81985 RepID=UPI000CD53FD3|nr:uncharacterized protein LOC17877792 isoform X2 [Capsella rubella]
MVSELENSGIDEEEEEEISESPPKLVFKFAFQTETFERLSREGYRSLLSDGSGAESEGSVLCSSSPAIFTAAASKYETASAKNLTFVMESPKAATFRVEDCLKEKEKTEGLCYSVFYGEEKARKTEDHSVFHGEDGVKTEYHHSVSSVDDKKIRFLTEEDFLESDSDFVDSSQTFTSNDEDGFLSDSDFAEASPEEEQTRKNESSDSDSEEEEEEEDGFESLWEHQDLIEQLKMEMKKVKAIGGLPTIREEEEDDEEDDYDCPKIMEDLKPWRIEEEKKFKHVDTIGEVHKFHRSYRERMRKLDILSFQKSYALGLLQLKNPQQAATSAVGSSPSQASFSSVFSVNIRLWKPKKSETEPMVQFIKEIQGELENVYVGHMCLSWEILHWQYEKAIELLESDMYGSRRYNEVAGEFQQFQVLLQRFLENEPFEEPRVQHYIKRRCVLRNLLQVPVIRDGNKDKKNGRRRDHEENDDGAIKSDQLVELMEETIRLFWLYVRCDKLSSSIHDQKSRTKSQIEPDHEEDSEDLEMFAEVKSQLQNKEKRLKDVLKSERCIIRRFQKHKEEDSAEDQVLYFFSQVDMKLVTRVLNMSKLTRDHLVWCRNKLTKINFVNRRLHLDPSFCLFPC